MTTAPYRAANYLRRKTGTTFLPGRPRTKPDTPAQQRRRARALRRYYERRGIVAPEGREGRQS